VPLLVDFGLTYGANISDEYLLLGSTVQGRLNLHRLAPADVLADFSDRAMGMEVSHQASQSVGALLEYSARTASVQLVDFDGSLDPYTLEAAGLTAPGVVMRLRWQRGGTIWPLFYGTVDAWETSHESPEHAVVTVTGTDGFALLEAQAHTELAVAVGAGDTTGGRVTRILDVANWPAAARSIGSGNNTLQATTMPGTALSELHEVAKNEAGELWIQPDGTLRFRSRRDILTDPRSVTSQVTYGSNRAGGEIPYVDKPSLTWDRTNLINTVRATRTGGTQQVTQDATSVGRYGVYATPDQELQLESDTAVKGWTTYVLAQNRDPETRFRQVTLQAAVDPDAMLPHMLGRQFGDRVTVVRRPPAQPFGSIVDSRECLVRSVQHSWSSNGGGMFTTVFGLQPVTGLPYLILGTSPNGRLNQNVLAY
jgi:hypothetical protein